MAKAAAKPESEFLEHVLIIGQDIQAGLAIKEASEHPGSIIIGDGEKGLTTEEIKSAIIDIKDKIGPDTQIHITCHGLNRKAPKGPTLLELHLIKNKPVLSQHVFKELTRICGKPLNISLYSCYSGTGKDDYTFLPKGSTLTTSADPTNRRLNIQNEMEILRSLRGKNSLDPFRKFVHSLCSDGKIFSSFGVHTDAREAFSSRAQSQAFSTEEIMRWQRFEIDRFIKHCDEIKSEFTGTQQEQFKALKESLGEDILDSPPSWLQTFQENSIDGYRTNLLFDFIVMENTNAVTSLIEAGVNVNAQNNYGYTALMIAADKGNTELVEKLITAQANVNIQNQYGTTALMLAVETGKYEVVETLIAADADANAMQRNGTTAIMIASNTDPDFGAMTKTGLTKLLLDHGANLCRLEGRDKAPIHSFILGKKTNGLANLLDASGKECGVQTKNGNTIFHLAAIKGDHRIINTILKHPNSQYIDLNAKNSSGKTALDIAKNKGLDKATLASMEKKMRESKTWARWAADTAKSSLNISFTKKEVARKKSTSTGKGRSGS